VPEPPAFPREDRLAKVNAYYFFMLAQLLEQLHREIGVSVSVPSAPVGNLQLGGQGNVLVPTRELWGAVDSLLPVSLASNDVSSEERERVLGLLELIGHICKEVDIGVCTMIVACSQPRRLSGNVSNGSPARAR
jgi:hypothetical protein